MGYRERATTAHHAPEPVRSGPWIGVIACVVMLLTMAALVVPAISRNGEFTYPIDDSYIHLAIGQNLAEQGVLGINPEEFSSASSSPVWPVLIAGSVLAVGPRIGVPLVLATLSAIGLLIGLDVWALRRRFTVGERALLAAAVLVVVPLPVLALTGMEHVLQVAFSFLLLWLGVVAATRERDRSSLAMLALASVLCTSTRFEALFVVAVTLAILAWARRGREMVAVALAGAVPVVAVGLVNVGQGWPLLPASVVAKTAATSSSGLAGYLPTPDLQNWARAPRLVSVVILTALVVWFGRRAMAADWPVRNTLFAVGTLAVAVLHLLFASTGFFYRYEGYLIVMCLGSIGLGLHTLRAAGRLATLPVLVRAAMVVLVVLAGVDGVRIHTKAIGGMDEIHSQQLQMARFAASACPGCRVAVNDIGAVALYGEGTVMDVYGLANNSVLERRLDGDYDTEATGEIADDEGVAFAMVYPPKEFSMIPGIPEGWERLGSWTIPTRVVVGDSVVDFYSVDPSRTESLQRAWDEFQPDGATKGP